MKIGVPKEIKPQENRIGLTPESVKTLVSEGHEVLVENNGGFEAGFENEQYTNAGAKIVNSAADIFNDAEIIVKVKEPQKVEVDMIRENQIIYTYLHLAAAKELTEGLIKSKSVSFNPCIHRLTKPHLFTSEELIDVIYNGDDSQHNSLVVDINGHIKLQKFEEARALFAPVAVRYETYCEGNDYVGPRAANDLINNDSVYLSMLSGFLTHLTNGRLDQYVDFPPMENETKILAEISNLTKHLN